MIRSKKILTVLVLVMSVVLGSIPAWAANESNALGIEFTATLNTPSIYVSDTEQTVEVTVKVSTEVDLDGIEANFVIPEGLTLTNVEGGHPLIQIKSKDLSETKVAWSFDYEDENGDDLENVTTTDLLVLTYTIPANTPAGSYELGVTELEVTKAYGEVWENTANATVTLTIAEPTPVYSGWKELGGDLYYYDPATNEAVKGVARVPYPDGYAPNAEDVAYEGADFIDAETGLFVFDDNGVFQKDLTGIKDGKYVKNGQIVWHYGLVEDGGKYYYFIGDAENGGNKLADDGVVYLIRTNGIDGFTQGAAYVVEGGIPQHKNSGLIEISGSYYYIRSNGEKVTGTSYWITNTNGLGVVAQEYTFDENGVMQNPVFVAKDATTGIFDGYYYEDGAIKAGAGLIELEDGSIIYVRSNGQVATGSYWATNHNGLLPEGLYEFGTDGKLVK